MPRRSPERVWSYRGHTWIAESVLDLCAAERVTMAAGVPTVWMAMLAALDAEPARWDLSALDRLVVGGAAVPRSMFEGFDRHGLTVVQAWGMTETAPLGSVCRLPASLDESDADEQYGYRAGRASPARSSRSRARDDEGQFIAWDDAATGELEVRGPWVAASYHGGRGADSFTADGWFKTGDVVRIDAHGCIRICDRSKDLVKSGGEWISSVDLENRLMCSSRRRTGRGHRRTRRPLGRAPTSGRVTLRRRGGLTERAA